MRVRNLTMIAMLVVIFAAFGCSSDNGSPIAPAEQRSVETGVSSHYNWGMWQFVVDPEAQTMDITPLRDASMHLNALPFLEPPSLLNLTLENLEFNGNIIEADIGLRHPFLGLTEFSGFDVCGILITNGSVSGFSDPDLVMAGDGDTRLLNPDGYSRWWNPAEFPVNEGTMFSYNDGLLGTPDSHAHYNSTLNGYKYFTDSLEPDDGLDAIDHAERGIFSAGQKNVRHYTIEIGSEGLVFNYAIDANWEFPQGDPPWQAPDDFGEGANRPEAWNIIITETNNTLWNDGSGSGGNLTLSIDVYDHYNADLNTVNVESPGNFDLASSSAPTGGGDGYSTYEINIVDATPAEGEIELLIAVQSDEDGYGGNIPGEPVAAYFTATVPVDTEPPITGVFVDGDNSGDPLEDGSMSHPFDTIQEGIDAAGVGEFTDIWEVYVDPYDGGDYALYNFKDDVQLIGLAFTGGSGKPELVLSSPWTIATGLDNIRLENFLITFNHTAQSAGGGTLFNAGNTDSFTIEDCKFTGNMSYQQSTFFSFSSCDDLTLEHNEFASIRNKSTYIGGYHRLMLMIMTSCNDVLIRHNEFHDIGYDDEGPSTTNNNTHTNIFNLRFTGGPPPVYCTNVHFYNNLIYDITNYSDTNSTAVNYTTILGWNAWVGYNAIPGFIWANNTADDITEIADDETKRGNAFFCYGGVIDPGWIVKNSIISNMEPLSIAIYYNGHRGFWADSCVQHVACTYCNCYNFGPVGHPQVRDYVNFFTKGVGSFGLADYQDPAYDMTPDSNWYHVTNSMLVSDPTDGGEMGAFGGPEGDWTPPSQE